MIGRLRRRGIAGGHLAAPHRRKVGRRRRLDPRPRLVGKAAVTAYRSTSWVAQRVPLRLSSTVIGRATQLSYIAWPAKRRWMKANFGHVLGLPPDHPDVRRLALAAYRSYGQYLAELMRLPGVPPEQAAARLAPALDVSDFLPLWKESPGGLIFVLGHIGNNEAVAAGIASHGWPISTIADDSSLPELFDDFVRLRQSWGVRMIPWRNLREIYGVLRRREMLAVAVDWGYRPKDLPVKFFDAWTTLPAGPATLAARTGARIAGVTIRRDGSGFHVDVSEPFEVPSTSPADLLRATQRIAGLVEDAIRPAPEQWYSFKPMWPATAAESAELERRAAAILAGEPGGTAEEPETG